MKKNKKIITFLFPLFPCKIIQSTRFLALIGALIALRILMNLISIPLPGFVMSISFSWVPVMLFGWFFGPIYGLFFGFITDTLCFFIFNSGYWFWMYAIQEPLVGFLSGIIAGIYRLSASKKNQSMWFDLLFHQIVLFLFAGICTFSLITWTNPDQKQEHFDIYKIISLATITLFMFVMEVFCFYNIFSMKKDHRKLLIFIYASILVSLVMIIFSFLLGPISTVSYLKWINGVTPNNYIKYGAMFYLVPRVIVQSIKVPIESLLLTVLVLCLNYNFQRIVQNASNTWLNKK